MARVKKATAKKTTHGTCCCGKAYRDRGGLSRHHCPAGNRKLCRECATTGETICPKHQVRVRF